MIYFIGHKAGSFFPPQRSYARAVLGVVIRSVWTKLDQSVVNHAIDECRRRLSACVSAEGGHLEHYL